MRSERDKNLPFTRQHNPFTSPLPLLYLNPFPRLVSFHLLLLYSASAASDHFQGQHQTKGIPLKNTLPGPLQDLDTPPPNEYSSHSYPVRVQEHRCPGNLTKSLSTGCLPSLPLRQLFVSVVVSAVHHTKSPALSRSAIVQFWQHFSAADLFDRAAIVCAEIS